MHVKLDSVSINDAFHKIIRKLIFTIIIKEKKISIKLVEQFFERTKLKMFYGCKYTVKVEILCSVRAEKYVTRPKMK